MLEEIRKEIEQVVEGYCDGTYQGLSHGHLIEYFGEGSNKTPQTLADEIMVVIERHLTKRVPDAPKRGAKVVKSKSKVIKGRARR